MFGKVARFFRKVRRICRQSAANRTREGSSYRPAVETLEERLAAAAGVYTDRLDYAPEDTVLITAREFDPGSTVQFQVVHEPSTPGTEGGQGHEPWSVTDGASGDL